MQNATFNRDFVDSVLGSLTYREEGVQYDVVAKLADEAPEDFRAVVKEFDSARSPAKELLAAVWHNWEWFARHIWGDDIEMPND